MNQKRIVIYYLSLSSIFFLLLILLNFLPSSSNIAKESDRIIIAFIFIIICIFGFSLSFYPRWYNKIIKNNNKSFTKNKVDNKKRNREGHHPNCVQFENHVIKIKHRNYCTGCLGLGIGSLISIFLIFNYLIFINSQSLFLFKYIFFLGFLIIYLSFFESILYNKFLIIHIFSNILLIIGFLLIIISTLENSGDLIYGIISIFASFLFLETRIQVSLLNHVNICFKCKDKCKMY